MKQDECLANIAEKVRNYAIIYVADITEVPGLTAILFRRFACRFNMRFQQDVRDIRSVHDHVLLQVSKPTNLTETNI